MRVNSTGTNDAPHGKTGGSWLRGTWNRTEYSNFGRKCPGQGMDGRDGRRLTFYRAPIQPESGFVCGLFIGTRRELFRCGPPTVGRCGLSCETIRVCPGPLLTHSLTHLPRTSRCCMPGLLGDWLHLFLCINSSLECFFAVVVVLCFNSFSYRFVCFIYQLSQTLCSTPDHSELGNISSENDNAEESEGEEPVVQ